jgi:pyrimidine operon attenuation protein/uracil phosphoribosyltransferase
VDYLFRKVMDKDRIRADIERISAEILKANKGVAGLALVGIRAGGAYIAQRIADLLRKEGGAEIPMGVIDITLYRDDINSLVSMPQVHSTDIGFDIQDKVIILVDDVLYTGRTVRAAIDQIIDFGRPKAIKLAVLIDRGHRELPIQPDFVGERLPSKPNERVEVELTEEGKSEDRVVIGVPQK